MMDRNHRIAVERLKLAVLERQMAKLEAERRSAQMPWMEAVGEHTIGASDTWLENIRSRMVEIECEIERLYHEDEHDDGESISGWERTVEVLQEELL